MWDRDNVGVVSISKPNLLTIHVDVDGVDDGAGDVVIGHVTAQLRVQILTRHALQVQLILHRSATRKWGNRFIRGMEWVGEAEFFVKSFP